MVNTLITPHALDKWQIAGFLQPAHKNPKGLELQ